MARRLLAGALFVLAARAVVYMVAPHAAEDAYIVYRVAENMAAGLGPYYNPDMVSCSVTSPMAMLLHVPAAWLGIPLDAFAQAAGVACDVGVVAVASRWERGFWPFVGVYASPVFGAVSLSGLVEVPLAVLCALASSSNRWAAVALPLLRPEGWLVGLLLRPRMAAAGIAASVALCLAMYGTVLPDTVAAKSAVYGLNLMQGWAWMAWMTPVAPAVWHVKSAAVLASVNWAVMAGLVAGWRNRMAWAGAAVLAVHVLHGTPYFWWYMALPAVLVMAAVAQSVTLPRVLWVVAALMWAVAQPKALDHARERDQSEGVFREMGSRLAGERGVILMEPAGIIGHMAKGLKVVDEAGLVTPDVYERRASGDPGWYADAVEQYRPDWILIRARFMLRGEAFAGVGQAFRDSSEHAAVMGQYHPEAVIPKADSLNRVGENALVLFRRKRD